MRPRRLQAAGTGPDRRSDFTLYARSAVLMDADNGRVSMRKMAMSICPMPVRPKL